MCYFKTEKVVRVGAGGGMLCTSCIHISDWMKSEYIFACPTALGVGRGAKEFIYGLLTRDGTQRTDNRMRNKQENHDDSPTLTCMTLKGEAEQCLQRIQQRCTCKYIRHHLQTNKRSSNRKKIFLQKVPGCSPYWLAVTFHIRKPKQEKE